MDLYDDLHGAYHQYDGLGNETFRLGTTDGCDEQWSYQYDAQRSLLLHADSGDCGALSYGYDEAGYVTSRDGVSLDWDGAGRIRAHGADLFRWDGSGRPVSRTSGGETTTWRFGGRVEATASGVPVALDAREVRIDLAGGSHLYRHLDFRNQVKFVTDESGEVVAHYGYRAYGLHELKSGDPDRDPHRRFAQGAQLGGLVLLGHRLLDPRVGRFLAPDPVYQLLNQHSYTTGNPYHYWDPGGLYQVTVVRALSIASLAFGVAGLVVTSPALALGLGITSVVLGATAILIDAASDPAVVHGTGPEARVDCTCRGGPGSGDGGSRGRGSGRGGWGPGQLKILELAPDLGAASWPGLGGLGFDFQLAGLIL
ncbi:MAG: RHS repeat domain-containing protein [Myxococcota bacterium]